MVEAPDAMPAESPTNGQETILDCRDLSVFYGSVEAVQKVNMTIAKGAVTGFIGPSGCGKSTLLRVFNRMNDFIPICRVDGQALFHGADLYDPSIDAVEVRRKIGMVFQKPNPFPKTIYQNIAWGPQINGMIPRQGRKAFSDELVERSLQRASLWDEVKDRLHESGLALSGGQQQRLCIARALAMDPEVILMDEPCSALDPRSTLRIEDLIDELKGQYTIVIVTHNMQQAARVSDYTAFFYEGVLIEYDKTNKIFTNPSQQQTEEYITGRFG